MPEIIALWETEAEEKKEREENGVQCIGSRLKKRKM